MIAPQYPAYDPAWSRDPVQFEQVPPLRVSGWVCPTFAPRRHRIPATQRIASRLPTSAPERHAHQPVSRSETVPNRLFRTEAAPSQRSILITLPPEWRAAEPRTPGLAAASWPLGPRPEKEPTQRPLTPRIAPTGIPHRSPRLHPELSPAHWRPASAGPGITSRTSAAPTTAASRPGSGVGPSEQPAGSCPVSPYRGTQRWGALPRSAGAPAAAGASGIVRAELDERRCGERQRGLRRDGKGQQQPGWTLNRQLRGLGGGSEWTEWSSTKASPSPRIAAERRR